MSLSQPRNSLMADSCGGAGPLPKDIRQGRGSEWVPNKTGWKEE